MAHEYTSHYPLLSVSSRKSSGIHIYTSAIYNMLAYALDILKWLRTPEHCLKNHQGFRAHVSLHLSQGTWKCWSEELLLKVLPVGATQCTLPTHPHPQRWNAHWALRELLFLSLLEVETLLALLCSSEAVTNLSACSWALDLWSVHLQLFSFARGVFKGVWQTNRRRIRQDQCSKVEAGAARFAGNTEEQLWSFELLKWLIQSCGEEPLVEPALITMDFRKCVKFTWNGKSLEMLSGYWFTPSSENWDCPLSAFGPWTYVVPSVSKAQCSIW